MNLDLTCLGFNTDENMLVELPKEILREFVIRGYLKIIYYHLQRRRLKAV
ncbi:hypothetical protein [Thermocrinis sp.]